MNIVSTTAQSYTPWHTSSEEYNMPREDFAQCIGYDQVNNSIYLLGGSRSDHDLIRYNLDSDNAVTSVFDYGLWYFPYDLDFSCDTQEYVQHNNTLFIMPSFTDSTRSIVTFDLLNASLNRDYIDTDSWGSDNGVRLACLTAVTMDHDYLFIIGGIKGEGSDVDEVRNTQIFDITTHSFVSVDEPYLISPRRNHGCVVVNDKIYTIGGQSNIQSAEYYSSIEVLDVSSGINNIPDEWSEFPASLTTPLQYVKAIVYGTDIVILGGYTYPNIQVGYTYPYYSDKIRVIDTLTETVTDVGQLNYVVRGGAPILVYPYIYIFGGFAPSVDTYQYHLLDTMGMFAGNI